MKTELSENAQKLYAALLKTNGAHESNLRDILFPPPKYVSGELNNEYWQWDVNIYGHPRNVVRNNNSATWDTFKPNIEKCYASQLSEAYQELRKAGLADESNNGYNSYWFYPVKRITHPVSA